jgi:hypothetical protein
VNIRQADEFNNLTEQRIAEMDRPADPDDQGMAISEGDPNSLAVAQVLDTEYKGINKEHIDTIYAYAKSQIEGNADPMTVKWVVRDLVDSIGSGALGEDKIARIARYAYLSLQSKRNEAERKSLLK